MITLNMQSNPQYVSPIRGCLFLAVPHRGTGNADTFGLFLKTVKKFLLPGMGPKSDFVEDLERKNTKLAVITERFVQLLGISKIAVISSYETLPYKKGKGPVRS